MLAGSSHELQLQLTAQDIIHIEKLMHLNASYNITCEADPNVESSSFFFFFDPGPGPGPDRVLGRTGLVKMLLGLGGTRVVAGGGKG